MEYLAWLMDRSIPVGRWTIGLDSLLGLVPGFGDAAGALVSMVIVVRAAAAGIPAVAVARMLANVAIDSFIGAIPIAGDLFDFAFKSNTKNLRIYEEALYAEGGASRHWGFFAALFLGLLAIAAIPIVSLILLFRAL
jgi:hypothetical protein